jgi:hypothetical protein
MRQSRGEVLQGGLRRELETTLGYDFGSIRIHHDLAAQRANEVVQANAFTLGSDIFFGPGQFNPESELGRHLLAHELTHSIQQGSGLDTAAVQRDPKGLSKEIAEKYAEFLKEAKKAKANPQMKAEAAQMRDEVDALIGQPISKVASKLPAAYVVVREKKKIVQIRRKPAWVFLVPKLRVVKGKLEYGFLRKYDPKAAMRALLRSALGCTKKQEAHHIIPLQLIDHPICKKAVDNGFNFNGKMNGECIGKKVHSGSHPVYTAKVRGDLDDLVIDHWSTGKKEWTAELDEDFYAVIARHRKNLKARKTKLK